MIISNQEMKWVIFIFLIIYSFSFFQEDIFKLIYPGGQEFSNPSVNLTGEVIGDNNQYFTGSALAKLRVAYNAATNEYLGCLIKDGDTINDVLPTTAIIGNSTPGEIVTYGNPCTYPNAIGTVHNHMYNGYFACNASSQDEITFNRMYRSFNLSINVIQCYPNRFYLVNMSAQ